MTNESKPLAEYSAHRKLQAAVLLTEGDKLLNAEFEHLFELKEIWFRKWSKAEDDWAVQKVQLQTAEKLCAELKSLLKRASGLQSLDSMPRKCVR